MEIKKIKKALKSILCLLLCLSMTIPAVDLDVQAEESSTNSDLLRNGSFSEVNEYGQASGWKNVKNDKSEVAHIVSNGELVLNANTSQKNQRLTLSQTPSQNSKLTAVAGDTYTLTASVKLVRHNTASGYLSFTYNGITFNPEGFSKGQINNTNEDWMTISASVTCESTGNGKFEIIAPNGSTIDAYIKDLKLVNDKDASTNLLDNTTFENTEGSWQFDKWAHWPNNPTASGYEIYTETMRQGLATSVNDVLVIKTNTKRETTQKLNLSSETINGTAGKKYQITGKVYVEQYSSGTLSINQQTVSDNGTETVAASIKTWSANTVNSDGTAAWVEFDETITVPETDTTGSPVKGTNIEIALSEGAHLLAKVDDLNVVEVIDSGETPENPGEGGETPTPPTFDSGLLVNGGFADDIADVTSKYGDGADGNAEEWQYWTDAKLPKTTLQDNGILIEALSTTNGAAERITIQQTVSSLEAGSTYRLTGAYNVSSTSKGSFSIDIKGLATIANHTSKTDDWQTFSQDVTLAAGVTSLQVRIMVSSGAELTAAVKEFKLEKVVVETPPTVPPFDSGLLVNGGFADDIADVTSKYGDGADGNAEEWQYWTNAKLPKTTLQDNGILIEALSTTNGADERITIQQTVSSLEAGSTYRLTGAYNVSSTSKGSFSIDINGLATIATHTSKTNDWQTFSQDVTLAAGVTSLQVRIMVSSGAELTAAVKEFKLEKVVVETPPFDSGLLVNGGFADGTNEDGVADDWQYYSSWSGAVAPKTELIENGVKIISDGTNSATAERISIQQTVSGLTPGKTYRLAGYYQIETISSGKFSIDAYVNKATYGTAPVSVQSSNTTEWIPFSQDITLEDGVTSIQVRIMTSNGAKVTASVKEVSLTEVPEPVPVDFVNGAFEDTNNDKKPDDWKYYNGTDAEAPSEVTEEGLKITADSKAEKQQRLTVHQTLTGFTAGHIYRFTGKYNISSYDEAANKQFIIRYVTTYTDNTNKTIEVVKHQNLTGGWLNFTKDIVIPQNVENIKVEIVVNPGAGMTVTVDDFKFTKIQEAESFNNTGILKNPEFKGANAYNITDWAYSPDNKKAVTYSAEVDSENGLALTANNTTEYIAVYQKVVTGTEEVPEDAVYKLTGKMKAADFAGSTFVRVRLDDAAGGSLAVVKQSPTITESTDGWADVEFQFEVPNAYYLNATDTTPKNVGDFKVELYVGKGNAEKATGTVSFKDLAVTKVSEIENNVVEGEANNSLFSNGGFERTYDGLPRWWSVWESTGGLKVSRDASVKRTGNYSLHIENVTEGAESRGSVHQTLTNIPDELQGQSVKISQWIKASDFTGTGFTIRLQYKTNSGAAVDLTSKYVSIPENVSDTGWQKYEYILDLPSNDLKQIKLEYLYDECVGDVWIDDLSVTTYIKAKGIVPSKDAVVLGVNATEQLTQTFVPENTTVQEVTYASSNEAVAAVSASGLITGVSEGTATIKLSHVNGAEKEVAVLVANSTFTYEETITPISTEAGVAAKGSLPEGYDYAVAAKPQYGALVINGTNYIYYPDAGFTGNDTAILVVTKNGEKALVTINISVGAAAAAPVFDDFIIATSKDTEITSGMLATDATTPSTELVYSVAAEPVNGKLTINGSNYTYTPSAGFVGYDEAENGTVKVTVTDTDGHSTTAEVTIYVSPAQSELASKVKSHADGSYLLADDAKFDALKAAIATKDSTIYPWFEDIKADVDQLLDDTAPFPAYQCSDGVRLDTQGSKDVVNLAFMYRVTGDQVYLNRAWMELENLCNPEKFPDWHPSHLLDVAMTANGVAIAYDWLYNYLENAQETHNVPKVEDKIAYVERALYEYALVEGKFQYEDNHMFVTNGFNWNYVCNGGFATAALALMHCGTPEYEALAAEVLQLAYKSVQNGLPQYAPEGDSIEGVSYWDYGTRYLVSFLACVSSATTVENPFLDTPGIYETALYPIYLTGKDGSFNYSDNDTADAVGYLNLWLAEAYNEPSYAWYHKYYMTQDKDGNGVKDHKACIYDLLYYNADYYTSDATPAKDNYYTAQAVTTMRTDYDDPNSAFVGFKGGITGAPHGDLDIGTVVYDNFGIRWITDLGKENYNIGDYWTMTSGSLRWGCYRKDASGHNTLVINPDASGENQNIGTYTGKVESSLNNASGGYTILDMTPAYQHEAAEVKRGVAFINRSQMLVRDEYVLKSAGDVYWQIHTTVAKEEIAAAQAANPGFAIGENGIEGAIAISADGKTATLTQNGKLIELRIVGDSDGLAFKTMTADFYGNKPTATGTTIYEEVGGTGLANKDEKGRGAFVKLYIKAEGVQTGSFSVLVTPADEKNPEVKELAAWNTYDFSKDIPGEAGEEYTVTVTSSIEGGDSTTVANLTGGGNYTEGTEATVTATVVEGFTFKGWYAKSGESYTGDALSTKLSYTFAVNADTGLVAVYKANGNVNLTVNAPKFEINGGMQQMATSTEVLKIGTSITVTYIGEEPFSYWMDANGKIVSTSESYSFTLTNNRTLTAVYIGATSGTSAFVEFISAYGQIMQAKTYGIESRILFPGAPSKVGGTFRYWMMDDGGEATETVIQQAIKDGKTHITLTPYYEMDTEACTITVSSVIGGKVESTKNYEKTLGSSFAVSAAGIEGQEFLYWSDSAEGTNVLSYSSSYAVVVVNDLTLYAIYTNTGEIVARKPAINVTNTYTTNENDVKKVSFVITRDVPDGYSIIEHGAVYSTIADTEDALVNGKENVKVYTSNANAAYGNLIYNIKVGNSVDTVINLRGYVTVADTDGNISTYYSGICSVSYNMLAVKDF